MKILKEFKIKSTQTSNEYVTIISVTMNPEIENHIKNNVTYNKLPTALKQVLF